MFPLTKKSKCFENRWTCYILAKYLYWNKIVNKGVIQYKWPISYKTKVRYEIKLIYKIRLYIKLTVENVMLRTGIFCPSNTIMVNGKVWL